MPDLTGQLLDQALALPPAERAELAEQLLASRDDHDRQRLDGLWAAEVEDRLDAFDRGELHTVPAHKVFDRLEVRSR